METNKRIQEVENSILHAYDRFPLVLDRGEDVYLYDVDGNKYLDFAGGIAVNALGYSNEEFKQALKDQIDKLLHTSNLYYTTPMAEAGRKLAEKSGMSKVFFTNSGTEAVEGALKAAKKYAYEKSGHAGYEIIAMDRGFHGRTVGALSLTGTAHYREPFEPLMDGVKFATFNDLESVRAQVNEKTCAIILETLQGEGGIYPVDPAFLRGIRKLCDERDLVMILDEIQCGMGRTGHWFAWQEYGVAPDIMTCAKALGCGIPVGAFVMNEKLAAHSLKPGDHGTTYGGNPLACAAVSKVFDIFDEKQIVAHVQEIAPYFESRLEELVKKHDYLAARRGKGLIQGLVVSGCSAGDVITSAIAHGLLVISAGSDVLRLAPPLVIEKAHIDEMIEKLDVSLQCAEDAAQSSENS